VLCCTNKADISAFLDLPSWVPNWNATKTQIEADRPVSYEHQKATGSSYAEYEFWYDGKSQILSAVGFFIASVIGYESFFVHINTDMLHGAGIITHLAEYSKLYRQLPHAYRRISSILGQKTLSTEPF
jgi:hypothetical protein